MKRTMKILTAAGFISAMMGITAYAGTWVSNSYPTPETYESEYESGQVSQKTYQGFTDDRSQASLISTDWKYQKDDGSYAASEWVQDEAGQYYYIGQTGTTAQGYFQPGSIDGNAYFFEPSDGHMIADAILGIDSVGGWDVDYTVNADGTWDFKPWDGFDLSNYQFTNYIYFDENGAQKVNGEIPGGTVINNYVQNVTKGVDGNGIPFLTIGNATYHAVKCSSWDKTNIDKQGVDGIIAKSAYHEFRTVYVRDK